MSAVVPTSESGKYDRGAVTAGIIVGAVVLLIIVGAVVLFARFRKMRSRAKLLDVTGTLTEPTPFEAQSEIVASQQFPGSSMSQKHQRGMDQQDNKTFLPQRAPSSSVSGGSPSMEPGTLTMDAALHPPRQDEVVWLCTQSEVEGFRRYMQDVHARGPAEDAEAPPEYS